jgi:O-antigen biosynthesis protein WbqP
VYKILPALTEWAQISRRDEIPIPQKCSLMLNIFTAMLLFDVKILWMTALKIINRDGVSH